MIFSKQVSHVVRFDLKRTSMWWAAHLILLTIMPMAIFGLPLHGLLRDVSGTLLPLLSWCIAMGLALVVVQADAPLSSSAFWKAKPIDSGAVAMAKLVVVGLVVLAATLSSIVALRLSGMSNGQVASTLRGAVPAYLTPLLLVALFRAVTRSLSTALMLSVGFLIVLLVTTPLAFITTAKSLGGPLRAASEAVGILAIFGIIVAIQSVYRMGQTSRPRRALLMAGVVVFGFLAAVSQVIALLGGTQRTSLADIEQSVFRVTADAPSTMPETVRFDSLPSLNPSSGSFPFTVMNAQPDRRYELQQVRITPFDIRGIGGRSRMLSTSPMGTSPRALDRDSVLAWSSDSPMATSEFAHIGYAFGTIPSGDDIDTVRTVALEGVVVRYRAERVKVVPFAPGVILSDSNIAIRLIEGENGQLELAWRDFGVGLQMGDAARGTSALYRDFAFVVIDSASNTARVLGSSSHESTTEWMVLPGATRTLNRNRLDYQPVLRTLMGQDRRSAAALVVYRWVEDGRRRIRQTLPVGNWPRAERAPRTTIR